MNTRKPKSIEKSRDPDLVGAEVAAGFELHGVQRLNGSRAEG